MHGARHILIFIISLICYNIDGKAQEFHDWELTNVVRANKLPRDTSDVLRLVQKAHKYIYKSPDSAIVYLTKAIRLSYKINYANGLAMALLDMGTSYYNKGRSDSARMFFEEGLPFAYMTAWPGNNRIPRYYTNIGTTHTTQGSYDSATFYYYKAISHIENQDRLDTAQLVSVYGNIAVNWMNLNKYDEALEVLLKGEALVQNNSKMLRSHIIYANLASAYINIKNLDRAEQYVDKLFALYKKNPEDPRILATAYLSRGHINIEKSQFEQAITHFNKILDLNLKDSIYGNFRPRLGLGWAYLEKKDYKKAEGHLLAAFKLTEKLKINSDVTHSILEKLTQTYEGMGNYTAAYKYLEKSKALQQKLLNTEKQRATGELEIKYRTAAKDRELTQKQLLLTSAQSKLKEKNIWLGAILSGTALLMTLAVFVYRNIRNKQKIQSQNLQAMQQEQEIANMRSMIRGEEKERTRLARELHDGIMVQLSTVKMNLKTLPQDHQALGSTAYYQTMVANLEQATKELRQTAHNLMPDMLLQSGIGEALCYFCNSLGKIQNLELAFQQCHEIPRLQPEFELAVYRIVQELVQNIIKHARASKAMVQLLNYRDEILTITVEDNGIGFTIANLDHNSGMGIKSIRSRIRALNGQMDLRSNEGKGTTVHLEFDIRPLILNPIYNNAHQDSNNG